MRPAWMARSTQCRMAMQDGNAGWQWGRELLLIKIHVHLHCRLDALFLIVRVVDQLIPFAFVYSRKFLADGMFYLNLNLLQPPIQLQPLHGRPVTTRAPRSLLHTLTVCLAASLPSGKMYPSQMRCSIVVPPVCLTFPTPPASFQRLRRSPSFIRLVGWICCERIDTNPACLLCRMGAVVVALKVVGRLKTIRKLVAIVAPQSCMYSHVFFVREQYVELQCSS